MYKLNKLKTNSLNHNNVIMRDALTVMNYEEGYSTMKEVITEYSRQFALWISICLNKGEIK